MIKATAYQNHAEVIIIQGASDQLAPHKQFYEDLKRLKLDVKFTDRQFNTSKRVWVVKNIQHYAHLSYIKEAIEISKNQLSLF